MQHFLPLGTYRAPAMRVFPRSRLGQETGARTMLGSPSSGIEDSLQLWFIFPPHGAYARLQLGYPAKKFRLAGLLHCKPKMAFTASTHSSRLPRELLSPDDFATECVVQFFQDLTVVDAISEIKAELGTVLKRTYSEYGVQTCRIRQTSSPALG